MSEARQLEVLVYSAKADVDFDFSLVAVVGAEQDSVELEAWPAPVAAGTERLCQRPANRSVARNRQ